MMSTPTPARIPNTVLGPLLGLDHSSVSRLRRGERGCSVPVMLRMEELFGWSVRDQHAAMVDGSFRHKFESHVLKWSATRPADSGAPGGLDG